MVEFGGLVKCHRNPPRQSVDASQLSIVSPELRVNLEYVLGQIEADARDSRKIDC